jgi:hypothetical protein
MLTESVAYRGFLESERAAVACTAHRQHVRRGRACPALTAPRSMADDSSAPEPMHEDFDPLEPQDDDEAESLMAKAPSERVSAAEAVVAAAVRGGADTIARSTTVGCSARATARCSASEYGQAARRAPALLTGWA